MNFGELFEQRRDEIECVRSLRMACHERLLPWRQVRIDFNGEFGKLLLELGDLRLCRGLGLHGGELFDLALDLQDRLFEVGEVAVHEGLTLTQMNSMLATEPTGETEAKRTTLPPLETWANNERMRHV